MTTPKRKPTRRAKTMRQMYGRNADRAKKAISEYTSRIALMLAFNNQGGDDIRSGFYATMGGKYFVVTAGHFLKNAYLKYFNYQPRPPYEWGVLRNPAYSVWPQQQPVQRATVLKYKHLDDPEDLLVLQVEKLPTQNGWLTAYDLENCPPAATPPRTKALVVGCLNHFKEKRYSKSWGREEYLLKPFHLWTHIVEGPHFRDSYDYNYHFCMNYKIKQDDPVFGVSAGGMSGGPVFRVPAKDEVIGLANNLLLGVQHGEYSDRKELKATRIEYVVRVVREFVVET